MPHGMWRACIARAPQACWDGGELRDAKAKTHWMSCVDVMKTPAKLHKYRTATYHKISTGGRVHLDGTPVAPKVRDL